MTRMLRKYWITIILSVVLLLMLPLVMILSLDSGDYNPLLKLLLMGLPFWIWFIYMLLTSALTDRIFTRALMASWSDNMYYTTRNATLYDTYPGSGKTRTRASTEARDDLRAINDYAKPGTLYPQRQAVARRNRQLIESTQTKLKPQYILCLRCGTFNPSTNKHCLKCAMWLGV